MPKHEARDSGTPEISKQRTVVPRLKPIGGYDYDLWVADGTEPDRLLLNGVVGVKEHSTMMAFAVMLHKAKMLGPKGPSFERGAASNPAFVADRMADALGAVGAVTGALDALIGKRARVEVVDVCMSLRRLPEGRGSVFCGYVEGLAKALDQARESSVDC